MSLRTVFVDFGGTLALEVLSRAQLYAREAQRVTQLEIDEARMARCMRAAAAHLKERGDCGYRYSQAWFRAFIEFIFVEQLELPPAQLPELEEALFVRFARPDTFTLLPGAQEFCEQLRGAGLRLAVVSNWSPALPGLLQGLGLAVYFEDIFTSAVEQLQKPNPRFFQLALERTGAQANETVHVGNDSVNDGDGARAAGLDTLLVHVSDPGDHPHVPDLYSARESLLSRLHP